MSSKKNANKLGILDQTNREKKTKEWKKCNKIWKWKWPKFQLIKSKRRVCENKSKTDEEKIKFGTLSEEKKTIVNGWHKHQIRSAT